MDNIGQKKGLATPGMFPNTSASMVMVTGKSTAKPTLSRITSVSKLAPSQRPNAVALLRSQNGRRRQTSVTRSGVR